MKQEFHVKQKFCLVNSYRNTISKWALGFRYRNFFIPRVEKNLKISPWEGNSYLPRAYGPWEERVSSLGLIFGGFFNPWDEEISIPETRPIRKSYISFHSSIFGMEEQKMEWNGRKQQRRKESYCVENSKPFSNQPNKRAEILEIFLLLFWDKRLFHRDILKLSDLQVFGIFFFRFFPLKLLYF